MAGTIIVKCGGENRAHIKRFGTETPVGGGAPVKVIKTLKCESQFQDETYGKNMRVANRLDIKGKATDKYVCTVCCREHTAKD